MRDPTPVAAALVALTLAGCGIQEHNAPERPSVTLPPSSPPSYPPPAMPPPPSMGNPGTGSSGGNPGNSVDAGAPGTRPPDARRADAQPAMPPPPRPGGAGIDIMGMHVPRERAVVIIHFGHSNMLGHGATPSALRPYFFTAQPRLWSYRGGGTFVPAVEPTASPRTRDTAGPGMALLRAAAATAPPEYHFISIGLGIGSATTQDWSKDGIHYAPFVAKVMELKGRVTYGAAIVMLGITDRHMPLAQQPGFADRMARIAVDLRADLGEPNLPVLHTDYEVESTGSLSLASDFARRIRPLILSLPMRIPNCAIIPTDMIGMQDDHHFDMQGHRDWSDRAIKILVDRGWAVWAR